MVRGAGASPPAHSNENPIAAFLRNVPVKYLDKTKFHGLIKEWRGVDASKSVCYPNKQNPSLNGWAIVVFTTEQARDQFMANHELHTVKGSYGILEKLRVDKWVQRPSGAVVAQSLPLYKSDLKQAVTVKEFDKFCREASIHSYKGTVHSHFTTSDLCSAGLIEMTLQSEGFELSKEKIPFHFESVWLCLRHKNCPGSRSCVAKCHQTSRSLADLLPVGTEVNFTARKIPAGLVGSFRYQAKAVWKGTAQLPDYVTSSSSKKLDEYLDQVSKQVLHDDVLGGVNDTAVRNDRTASCDGDNQHFGASSTSESPGSHGQNGCNKLNQAGGNDFSSGSNRSPIKEAAGSKHRSMAPAANEEGAEYVEAGVVRDIVSPSEAVIYIPNYGVFPVTFGHFDTEFNDFRHVLVKGESLLVAFSKVKGGVVSNGMGYRILKVFLDNTVKKETCGAEASFENAKLNAASEGLLQGDHQSLLSDQSSPYPSNGEEWEAMNNDYTSIDYKFKSFISREFKDNLLVTDENHVSYLKMLHQLSLENTCHNEKLLIDFLKEQRIDGQIMKNFLFKLRTYLRFLPYNPESFNYAPNKPGSYSIKDSIIKRFLDFIAFFVFDEALLQVRRSLYDSLFRSVDGVREVWLEDLLSDAETEERLAQAADCHSELMADWWFKEQATWQAIPDIDFNVFWIWFIQDTSQFKSSQKLNLSFLIHQIVYFGIELNDAEAAFVMHQRKKFVNVHFIILMIVFLKQSSLSLQNMVNLKSQDYSKNALMDVLHTQIISKSQDYLDSAINIVSKSNEFKHNFHQNFTKMKPFAYHLSLEITDFLLNYNIITNKFVVDKTAKESLLQLEENFQSEPFQQFFSPEVEKIACEMTEDESKVFSPTLEHFSKLTRSYYKPRDEITVERQLAIGKVSNAVCHKLMLNSGKISNAVDQILQHIVQGHENKNLKSIVTLVCEAIEREMLSFGNALPDVFTLLKIACVHRFKAKSTEAAKTILPLLLGGPLFSAISTLRYVYNVDGIVVSIVADNLALIQTELCQVLAHVGVIYKYCDVASSDHDGADLPIQHWASCRYDADMCHLVGTRVKLHGKKLLDKNGDFICCMALLVWAPVGTSGDLNDGVGTNAVDPPDSWVLLPVSQPCVNEMSNLMAKQAQVMDLSTSLELVEHARLYHEAWMRFIPFGGPVSSAHKAEWERDASRISRLASESLDSEKLEREIMPMLKKHVGRQTCCLDELFLRLRSGWPAVRQDKTDEPKHTASGASRQPIKEGCADCKDLMDDFNERLVRYDALVKTFQATTDMLVEQIREMQIKIQQLENRERVAGSESKSPLRQSGQGTGREYVRLSHRSSGPDHVTEVLTNQLGNLSLASVQAVFPETTSILFKPNSSKNIWRALLPEGNEFHPPDGGWENKTFICSSPKDTRILPAVERL